MDVSSSEHLVGDIHRTVNVSFFFLVCFFFEFLFYLYGKFLLKSLLFGNHCLWLSTFNHALTELFDCCIDEDFSLVANTS